MLVAPSTTGRLIENIDKNTDAPERIAERRRGEAAASVLRARLGPGDFEYLLLNERVPPRSPPE
jgi:hypothetical protein